MPSVAFFEFCDFFLDKYKDDKSVAFLSGNNYAKKYQRKEGIDHIYADFFLFLDLPRGEIVGRKLTFI